MAAGLRLAILLIAAAALAGGGARAQDKASVGTTGTTSVTDPAAISVTQNLAFIIPTQTLSTGLTITSSAVNGVNANVVLTGNQATSVSVPATFDVTRVGGTDSITVRTVGPVTNLVTPPGTAQVAGVANGGVFSSPVNIVGTIDSGVLSFSVAGQVTLASNLAPGEYQGVLTVIAQYN
jgi:hypothetical protein